MCYIHTHTSTRTTTTHSSTQQHTTPTHAISHGDRERERREERKETRQHITRQEKTSSSYLEGDVGPDGSISLSPSPPHLPPPLLPLPHHNHNHEHHNNTQRDRETERQRDRERRQKKPKYNERFARPSIMVSCFFATFLIYEYIDKKIVFICYHESSRTPQHSEWNCVGANRPQHMHMYGHCLWLNFEHIKNSNRSKKLIFATKKIEIESAKYFKNPPKWFEFISARMVLGLWDLSLLTVFYVVWVCSCGASFITATVSFKIDSGTRTPTICSTIRSETCSWHMSFVCELPSLLV